ncbi:MAG TPA: N-formylglutamate amidohydrolase [Caulobacteraceae bacterium]|nr:N-formylglutamate amidohydrolase [Caulobacteraceae bacterium]
MQNPGAASPLLLVGDHAGREIPVALQHLGLPAAALQTHIALDIGVAGLGAVLSEKLDATFVSQRFSRLVIDCNRDPERADSIVELSDGVAIPGNADLSRDARDARVRRVFHPYHDRIASEIEARVGRQTLLVALHSFTPALVGGAPRPWHVGVLHLGGSPACEVMLQGLRATLGPDMVGDNQPYEMDGTDYTVPRHAIAVGLDYLELEVRQDLIATLSGQAAMADLLAPLLRRAAGA